MVWRRVFERENGLTEFTRGGTIRHVTAKVGDTGVKTILRGTDVRTVGDRVCIVQPR